MNRLVKEVFNHPKSGYSLFVYELIRRRVLGTTKKEFRETGHDFGIKDIEGYFDWDDNSQQIKKSEISPRRIGKPAGNQRISPSRVEKRAKDLSADIYKNVGGNSS